MIRIVDDNFIRESSRGSRVLVARRVNVRLLSRRTIADIDTIKDSLIAKIKPQNGSDYEWHDIEFHSE